MINIVQFLPSEQFHFNGFRFHVSALESLGYCLRLAAHMTISGSFLIDRIAQFQSFFDSFRTQVEQFAHNLGNLAVAHVYTALTIGVDIDINRFSHTDGITDLYEHLVGHSGCYHVLGDMACGISGRAVYL